MRRLNENFDFEIESNIKFRIDRNIKIRSLYLQLGHTQIIFWIEFLRSSRKAFSGNRATSPIFYIRFAHAWMDNSPRT